MLQLTPPRRIFLAGQPVDLRKGSDGLAALCRQTLSENPLSGAVSVFRNRTGTTRKLLASEGQGFWLCTNRLSQGRCHWWPTAATSRVTLSAQQLSLRLWNGNPERAPLAPLWRPVSYAGTSAAGYFPGSPAPGLAKTSGRCSWTATRYSSAVTPACRHVALPLVSRLALEALCSVA